MKYFLFITVLLLSSGKLFAHASGEDYIFVNVLERSIEGEFQVNIKDLRSKLGIDITDTEERGIALMEKEKSVLFQYIRQNFSIAPIGEAPYSVEFAASTPEQATAEFIRFPFSIDTGTKVDAPSMICSCNSISIINKSGLYLATCS